MTTERPEQQQERVHRHLEEARERIEQDVFSTTDITMQRLEVDAATVATLAIVAELLPEPIQTHVQAIIDLHNEVWQADAVPGQGATPRKPLGQRLFSRFPFLLPPGEARTRNSRHSIASFS